MQPIIDGLTEPEKAVVLTDQSADGWAYSRQFAQFMFITETDVRSALPSEPVATVSSFIARYTAEQQRVQASFRKWTLPPRSKL